MKSHVYVSMHGLAYCGVSICGVWSTSSNAPHLLSTNSPRMYEYPDHLDFTTPRPFGDMND